MTELSLRVATRGSELALWQTRHVVNQLGIECELVVTKVSADGDLSVPISELGGQGAFVKALQEKVLSGEADFAVHSAKDMTSQEVDGLQIAAFCERGNPSDALVGCALEDLPEGARVATGSVRRRAQLLAVRPDLKMFDLRGNIQTRVAKARDFDAVVVAAVAMQRLGLEHQIAEILPTAIVLPQVGQGAIAVECRADNKSVFEKLRELNHGATEKCVLAERAFLNTLGGDCSTPEGALATMVGEDIHLHALIASDDGSTMLRYQAKGASPELVGRKVADVLLDDMGGRKMIEASRVQS